MASSVSFSTDWDLAVVLGSPRCGGGKPLVLSSSNATPVVSECKTRYWFAGVNSARGNLSSTLLQTSEKCHVRKKTSSSRVLEPSFVAPPKPCVKLRQELSGAITHISAGQGGEDIKRFENNQRVTFTVIVPTQVLRCCDPRKVTHVAEVGTNCHRADTQSNCTRRSSL